MHDRIEQTISRRATDSPDAGAVVHHRRGGDIQYPQACAAQSRGVEPAGARKAKEDEVTAERKPYIEVYDRDGRIVHRLSVAGKSDRAIDRVEMGMSINMDPKYRTRQVWLTGKVSVGDIDEMTPRSGNNG